jgi:hypothetical protein
MKHLKSYKIFESAIEDLENYVQDILRDLEDNGLQVNISRIHKDVEDDTIQRKVKRTDVYLEVYITRHLGSPNRVIPGVPQPPSGSYPGNLFFWYEVKDAIIRLNNWYYDYSDNEYTPGISGKTAGELAKIGIKYNTNSPFRMFNSGIEFGIGWHKPEDFNGIGDYISFTNFRLMIKL